MIRFTPDTAWDALMRPIAMGAPNSWVYIELIAPDFRFAFILALVFAWAILAIKKKWVFSPIWILLCFVSLCFIPWLYTTGNGRYFMPMLLAAGPICVGLINELPVTKDLRLFLALGAVVLQAFAVVQNNPWNGWNTWGFTSWGNGPYFDIELDHEAHTQPASYVTVSIISYGLIAPLFPPESRWMNISSQTGADVGVSADSKRVQSFLNAATNLKLVLPTIPTQMTHDGQPDAGAVNALNVLLAPFRAQLAIPTTCRLLPSSGLIKRKEPLSPATPDRIDGVGFWICNIKYPSITAFANLSTSTNKFEAIFNKLESICPRFFTPGQQGALPMPHGAMRHYQGADMRAYAFEDGTVYYKYFRALNPEYIGNAEDILSGKTMLDCKKIKGRSGLPWDREI